MRIRTALRSGCAFALAIACVLLGCRASLLAVALREGYLRASSWSQLGWLVPAAAYDVTVLVASGALVAALGVALGARLRPLALAVGYVAFSFATAVCLVSIPLYASLQTTLHWTQLLLMGGVRDIAESGFSVVPSWALGLGVLGALGVAVSVPRSERLLGRFFAQAHPQRRMVVTLALLPALVLAGGALPLPRDDVAGLERNPVFDFVASAVRWTTRSSIEERPDMRRAPHFDSSPMFDERPAPDATESLVDLSALPLSRANVALVVLESASVHHTGLWGGRPDTVPRLQALKDRALLFDAYYASAPVSMKSLLSLTCSTYADPRPEADTYSHPALDCLSLSEILETQGYRTGLFHGGRFSYTRKDRYFRHRNYDVMRDAETLVHRKRYRKVPWGVDDRAVLDDALAWLGEGSAAEPFLLTLVFLAPHHPYNLNPDVPTPFGTQSSLGRYRNATKFIDAQVGRLWDWLVAHGRDRDTLLVVVGDHGEAFGEHRGQISHGQGIYEESVRAPLMLVNERLFRGVRSARVGNHLDLVPTVLDLLGLPKPARHQGQSLLRDYRPRTIHFYADWHGHYLGLRDGRWKYLLDVDRDRDELYDLHTDPSERYNLTSGKRKQAGAYAKRVQAWERFYRELLPNYDRYMLGKLPCVGPARCYLDDVAPTRVHGKMKPNRCVDGSPLKLGRKRYRRGFGVTPPSILAFRVQDAGFRWLRGAVGHHAQGGHANLSLRVSAEIYVDDRLAWSSGKLAADEPAKPFDVPIENAKLVELVGYDVDGETWRDYLDWVDVRLEQ